MIHRKGEPDEQQVLGYLSHALDKHSLAQQSQQCCELQEKEEVDGILPSNFSLQLSTDDRNSLCLNGWANKNMRPLLFPDYLLQQWDSVIYW